MFTKWQVLSGQSRFIATHRPERPPAMGLFKPDFYRMFAIGFAVGALFVASTTDFSFGEKISSGVVPVAEAQAAR